MQEYQQENQVSIFDDGELEVQERSAVLKLSANTKIFAILILVNGILGLLAYFTHVNRPKPALPEGFASTMVNAQNNIIFAIIGFGFNVLFFYFLYRFSTRSKAAIENLNQADLVNGFNSLGVYFKIIGALIILGLVIFVCSFLLFGLGRLMA